MVLVYTLEEKSTKSYTALGFCVSLSIYIGGFAITQIWMVSSNFTTIEMTWKENVFDLGTAIDNCKQVLGKNVYMWMLPFGSTGLDGTYFPVKIRNKTGGFTYFQDKFLV